MNFLVRDCQTHDPKVLQPTNYSKREQIIQERKKKQLAAELGWVQHDKIGLEVQVRSGNCGHVLRGSIAPKSDAIRGKLVVKQNGKTEELN